jgi:hypothetical protein
MSNQKITPNKYIFIMKTTIQKTHFSFLAVRTAFLLLTIQITFTDHLHATEYTENPAGPVVIKGHITDELTGEDLIGASLYIHELGTGASSNVYGFYSLHVPPGRYTLRFSYIGYQSLFIEMEIGETMVFNAKLLPTHSMLQEVVVSAEKLDANVTDVRMSSNKLRMEMVKALPAFMGETDVIKTLMLLPGVSSGGEGSTGFFVRGGGADQNLILLDEATVYNASHLMGFFSVFNPDAIKDAQIYKGGIPAHYGGRLSSVVDIRMKDGNNKNFTATGGVGSISSRLTLEGPLQKDVSSFILSGRRTYADMFLAFASDTNLRNNRLYFYDLNAKANYRFSDKDRIFFSGYFGRDLLRASDIMNMGWGNSTATLRWNHIFNSRMFSNFTLIYSDFDYMLGSNQGVNSFEWSSQIENYTAKADFTWYYNPNNTLSYGLQTTHHRFTPGVIKGVGEQSGVNGFSLNQSAAQESAIYLSNEQKILSNLTLEYGIRYSLFQSIGKAEIYNIDSHYNVTDTIMYGKGEIYHTDQGVEPRLGLVYELGQNQSVKASYNRTRQYLQQTSMNDTNTPLDIWFPASPNVKAQYADQYAMGYFRNFSDNTYESSIEVYYKDMQNQVDFKDFANVLLNPHMEADLRRGKAWSYGMEFMFNKTKGDLTGWFSYTLSRAWNQIDEINEGRKYPATFDRPHDISVALAYQLTPRMNLGATWVFHSGRPATLPIGRYEFGGEIIPIYDERNASRLPDYHRLDLSLTLDSRKKPNRNWEGSWNFSVFNAYARKNAFQYSFKQNETNPYQTDAYKIYLFSIIPSVSYNFKF